MISDIELGIARAAAERWDQRSGIRNERAGQTSAEIETPARISKRMERLRINAAKPTPATTGTAEASVETMIPAMVHTIGLERVLAEPDFRGIAFLEQALAVARFVGRVNIKDAFARTLGHGTGFMVSPRLLMTNNHVLPSPELARASEIEFDFQNDRLKRPMTVAPFALEPGAFFLTSTELDFTLVAVSEVSRHGKELAPYGWSRLIPEEGKALIKERLNIIQHPRGRMKEIAFRSNELIDLLPLHAHYTTDTEPGSSGSPVYNDQWEVVALHHSGVPKRDAAGRLVKADDTPWRDGDDPEELVWVANEGVRISVIHKAIEDASIAPSQAALRRELLERVPPDPLLAAVDRDERAGGTARARPSACEVTFELPLRITISLGQPADSDDANAILQSASVQSATSSTAPPAASAAPQSPEAAAAIAELERSGLRPYCDAAADKTARDRYWEGLAERDDIDPGAFFHAISERITRTHSTVLPYKPARHLYPWVDLRPGDPPRLKSLYSDQPFDPHALIEEEFRMEAARERMIAEGLITPALEADLPFNCEHVVPQSWFAKRQPMRGDLHHLFACESRCNSFRNNTPYFDFPDFEEVVRHDCGKSDADRFEPSSGKGAAARATLYFLLRYPGEIGDRAAELPEERLEMLLAWHEAFPVDEYERHRNAAIEEKQGNRNPLIDFPAWARRIDFGRGFFRAPGPVDELAGAGDRRARSLSVEQAAARMFAAAERTARGAGMRIRPDAASDLRQRAEQGAQDIRAEFGGFDAPEAARRLAEGEAAFAATAQLMILARPMVYAGAVELLAASELGEDTLAWARAKLCPLFPIC